MTRPRYWPLGVVLLSDVLGVPLIVFWWVQASFASLTYAAYLAFGLLIVQLPLCIYGAVMSRKANRRLFLTYVVHAVGTVVLLAVAERGGFLFFQRLAIDWLVGN